MILKKTTTTSPNARQAEEQYIRWAPLHGSSVTFMLTLITQQNQGSALGAATEEGFGDRSEQEKGLAL